MLQPSQLTDVSIRYAEEIVELRDFLVKAGCAVRTGQVLGQIADRLSQDRAFHRDLTSHVWVLMDRYDRISHSDLLGVLAIAAAGSGIASTADEDDAHRLLRFLMEARHSLEGLSDNKNGARETAAVVPPAGEPLLPVRGGGHEVPVEPLQVREKDQFSWEELHDRDRRRRGILWVVAAVCVLLAVFIGVWLKHRPAEYAGNQPASAPAATPAATPGAAGIVASSSAPTESVAPPAVAPEHRVARAGGHSAIARRNARGMVSSAARSSREAQVAAPYISSPAANVPPPVSTTATRGPAPALPAPAPAQPAPAASATAPTAQAPSARPANALSTPAAPVVRAAGVKSPALGGPPAPPKKGLSAVPSLARPDAQQSDDEVSSSKTPVLRRRHPAEASATQAEDGTTNVAAGGTPPAVPAARGNGSAGAASGAGQGAGSAGGTGAGTGGGTVHGTSLGAMAANLMYDPMPAYPAAAAASHVQGEVKLSADVDREGKVASVRVISGPALLREAAMDAVGHWRYRPYRSSGGPMPMAAIEVLDFELP